MIARSAFGRTGHNSSRVIFGAAALSSVSQAEADRTLEMLLEYGVNHIDTAALYGDSELRIAPWLKREPDAFFVATKTIKRTRTEAKEDIERSLDRLGVSCIDLIQLHNLVDVIEWEFALREGGALEALVEARAEGLVRFVGVTGHGRSVAVMHRRSLERFPFDSVLLPYNFRELQDRHYKEEFEALAALCTERGVAIQTIKSIAFRPWEGRPQTASTWYEPLVDPAEIEVAVHWVLGRDGIFLNSVGDVALVPHVLEAANRFVRQPVDAAMQALVDRRSIKPLFT
jgi:aryl-alcohol dehydrogenase-like predicted oxidoreductase